MPTETLPCRLTDNEVMERTRTLLDLLQREDDLETQKKNFNEAHKEATTVACAETKRMRRVVSTRSEPREVEVLESHDYKRGIAEISRLDTSEVVRTRPLTEAERQAPLFQQPQRDA